ncbi:MAG: serine hydrolase domain-containing protein [Gemmatimonadaceae bacterium]|jgi:CubicO group peptidase (beta-lactamase class C family)
MKRFLLLAFPAVLGAQDLTATADRIFAQWNSTHTPGCAVGVSRNGVPIFTRGYGMADLESGTPITAQTILESGSVAKQFTATAILLLVGEGKIRLDDDVRKYVPELPQYGRTITIRHLVSHTSGLREWSNLVADQGYPRGTRVTTQADLVNIIVRQKALNYPVGDFYSYTNSGFSLLPTIVERVSGMPFVQFSNERIFKPAGMVHTRWRDDFTVVVPGRAQAYSRTASGWRINMPFENVHGPGGLLTTVGDWLKWNHALDTRVFGAVSDSLLSRATLTSGRQIPYAMGMINGMYRGTTEWQHSGSTAGYSTFLARYPKAGLSIAVLCNAAGAPATSYVRQLADALIPDLAPPATFDTTTADPNRLARLTGIYRDERTNDISELFVERGQLRIRGGAVLRSLRDGDFLMGASSRLRINTAADGSPTGARIIAPDGDTLAWSFMAAERWKPTEAQLQGLTGRWHQPEIDATWTAKIEKGALVMELRPGTQFSLVPAYADAFEGGNYGSVWFSRDKKGNATQMHLGSGRVWKLSFQRETTEKQQRDNR